jgi:hypothetical protein
VSLVLRICKNDYHLSAGSSRPGERGPPERYQSQITLIRTTGAAVRVQEKRRKRNTNVPFA